MKVKNENEATQPCLTLSDPIDYSLQGSSTRGIFQARVLEWAAIAFSRLSSRIWDKTGLLLLLLLLLSRFSRVRLCATP